MSDNKISNDIKDTQDVEKNTDVIEEVTEDNAQGISATPALVIPPKEKKNYL